MLEIFFLSGNSGRNKEIRVNDLYSPILAIYDFETGAYDFEHEDYLS